MAISVRIEPDGAMIVTGSTQAELELGIAAARQAMDSSGERRAHARTNGVVANGGARRHGRVSGRKESVLNILNALREASDSGITPRELADKCNLNPAGVGAEKLNLNNYLRDVGLRPSEVFETTRVGKRRLWKGQRGLANAIDRIRQLEPATE